MSIRHRPIRPNDVRECVEIVAAHPIVSARYGGAIADLCPVWLRMVAGQSFAGNAVFEEVEGSRARMLGVGASVFVSDDFLRELKTPPFFWIGPELLRRMGRGDSPLLSEDQIREANSRGGLNLAVWQACVRLEDIERMEVMQELMVAFLKSHRGFLLKEMVAQGESMAQLLGMRNSGVFLCKSNDGHYGDFEDENLDDIMSRPHVVGVTRQLARTHLGSWIGTLFRYQPPRCGFSRSEQRLLLAALEGGTDEGLSDALTISPDTVKKTWRLVYARVAARLPELIASDSPAYDGMPRGKEKKQRLLAYLREHPEELRPLSRKLLGESAA